MHHTRPFFKLSRLNLTVGIKYLLIHCGIKLLFAVAEGKILSSDITFNCHKTILLHGPVRYLENG